MEKPNFLSEKYADLPGSKPVERAVQKKIRTGEKPPHTREERVEAYLERFDEFFNDPEKFEHLKYKILEKYTTKYEEIPESYWKAQEAEIRRRGEGGDWEGASESQKEEVKRKTAESVLNDQRASLEQWLDYFALSDSDYIPKEIKYWIFRNILNLKELEKTETQKPNGEKVQHIEFPKRSKGTVSPYPDRNEEALGYVVDALLKKFRGQEMEFEYDIQPDEREQFKRFLAKEDFAKLYAWANELMNPIPEHLLPVTEGKWMRYEQGSTAAGLVKTIRGRGTGWCTAGENTASKQLEAGDFYVYYSLDDDKQPTVPRLAIRMEQDKIAEVRGVAYKQNLDPYMPEVLEEKLKEFGAQGQEYKQKSADMKLLTQIEAKTKKQEPLGKDDLSFLYELNAPIRYFGYNKDPRIAELRKHRNAEDDMPVIFDCQPEDIAYNPAQIKANTKAYVGKLEPGIFTNLSEDVEHIYTSFPEGRIRRIDAAIGGKTVLELETELKAKQNKVYEVAQYMFKSKDFNTLKNREQIKLVRLKVRDLFSDEQTHTTQEIYARAEGLGLDICPAEVGPHYRLQYQGQPMNEYLYIGMKPITGRNGYPNVFLLGRDDGGLWLSRSFAKPGNGWDPGDVFVFCLRKSKT